MVLARKKSTYAYEEEKGQQPKGRKNKKRRKSYIFEKIIITFVIIIIFACCMLILTRFMTIAETKHKINNLEKQLEKLEADKVKLKIEVERVSKSGWVENEAKSRLQMDYPTPEQTISININPTKVVTLTNEVNQLNNNSSAENDGKEGIYTFFEKLISFLKI